MKQINVQVVFAARIQRDVAAPETTGDGDLSKTVGKLFDEFKKNIDNTFTKENMDVSIIFLIIYCYLSYF